MTDDVSTCGFTRNEHEECCGKPGVTHFHFGDGMNGITCAEHSAFVRPSAIDEHPVGPDCPKPHAVWRHYVEQLDDGTIATSWSTCIVPLEHGLTATVDVARPEPELVGGRS